MNQSRNNQLSKTPQRLPLTRQRQRGMQLVEVILVMPVLLMLIAASAEFGRYFYTYSALARATEVSARYLSGHLQSDSGERTTAVNLAVCGQLTTCGANAAVVPGLTSSNIDIVLTLVSGSTTRVERVTVRIINFNYQSVFNLGNWTGSSWTTIAVSPSTTMQYLLED